MIKVAIVDDQKLFASSMKVVLEGYGRGGIHVVGVVYNGQEALTLMEEERPDVVLMDVRMPKMDGVKATRIIHERYPEVKIIILTTFADDDYVHDALCHGAVGYILKDIQPEELVQSIQAVHGGAYLLSTAIGNKVKKMIAAPEKSVSETDRDQRRVKEILNTFPDLVNREAQVLDLILQVYDNYEIAERLEISEQTVRNYSSSIYAKLGVKDRVHAIRMVRKYLSR